MLSRYFKAPNYLDEAGYYSAFYELTYYDGYGYNFYTGAKGYYEYSRPPPSSSGSQWSASRFVTTLSIMTGVLALFSFIFYKYDNY